MPPPPCLHAHALVRIADNDSTHYALMSRTRPCHTQRAVHARRTNAAPKIIPLTQTRGPCTRETDAPHRPTTTHAHRQPPPANIRHHWFPRSRTTPSLCVRRAGHVEAALPALIHARASSRLFSTLGSYCNLRCAKYCVLITSSRIAILFEIPLSMPYHGISHVPNSLYVRSLPTLVCGCRWWKHPHPRVSC